MSDGLRGCANCGNDTTGRLCRLCAEQEAIDNDDMREFLELPDDVYFEEADPKRDDNHDLSDDIPV